MRWARELYTQLKPFARDRAYINFLDGAEPERVRAAYGERKYARLTALKKRYDPTNFFRLNQNIRPFAEGDEPGARRIAETETADQPG